MFKVLAHVYSLTFFFLIVQDFHSEVERKPIIDVFRAGGVVGPKIVSFMVKALYFQSYGRTKNCRIEVLFKWSDQSCTPSAAPGIV